MAENRFARHMKSAFLEKMPRSEVCKRAGLFPDGFARPLDLLGEAPATPDWQQAMRKFSVVTIRPAQAAIRCS